MAYFEISFPHNYFQSDDVSRRNGTSVVSASGKKSCCFNTKHL